MKDGMHSLIQTVLCLSQQTRGQFVLFHYSSSVFSLGLWAYSGNAMYSLLCELGT